MVDFYGFHGFHVGKIYQTRPMDPSWGMGKIQTPQPVWVTFRESSKLARGFVSESRVSVGKFIFKKKLEKVI